MQIVIPRIAFYEYQAKAKTYSRIVNMKQIALIHASKVIIIKMDKAHKLSLIHI